MTSLEDLINEISSNVYFLKLKSIVENSAGWHDQEDVYSHSIKTADIAKNQIEGGFIINPEANEKFHHFINENVYGQPRKDLMVLIGLVHDCGKILSYKEEGNTFPLIANKPDLPDQTMCPGHEYYGGKLVVKEILKNITLSSEAKDYIADIVRLHDSLNNYLYYVQKSDWPIEAIVSDIKSKAEGYYIEAMFNAYCDCYTAKPFQQAKKIIENIFNTPSLYKKRKYFLS